MFYDALGGNFESIASSIIVYSSIIYSMTSVGRYSGSINLLCEKMLLISTISRQNC